MKHRKHRRHRKRKHRRQQKRKHRQRELRLRAPCPTAGKREQPDERSGAQRTLTVLWKRCLDAWAASFTEGAGARSEARRGRGAQGAGEGDAAGLPVAEWRELRGQSPVGAPHAADREGGQAVRSRMSHREGCGTIRSHWGL